MSNLIPDNEKKEISSEYNKRLAVVCLCLAIFWALIVIALLVPAYTLSYVMTKRFQANNSPTLNEQNAKADYQKQADEQKVLLRVLSVPDKGPNPTDLFSVVVKDRPYGVSILSLDYSSSTNPMLSVDGTASDRKSLQSFVDVLESEPSAASVDIPISDFAKDSNIDFSIKIGVKIK